MPAPTCLCPFLLIRYPFYGSQHGWDSGFLASQGSVLLASLTTAGPRKAQSTGKIMPLLHQMVMCHIFCLTH